MLTEGYSQDRRSMIKSLIATGVTAGALAPASGWAAEANTGKQHVYVGAFTTPERDGRGLGIGLYEIDGAGKWLLKQTTKTVNPCWLLADEARNLLFCANADQDYLTAFRIERNSGALSLLGTAPTGGLNSLYLTFDPLRRFLICANYSSSNVSVFSIDDQRGLGQRTDVFKLTGTPGPNRVQQNVSEPHQVLFDPTGRLLIVPDKGVDKIHVLSLEEKSGKLMLESEIAVRSGTGPRHAVFHPTESILYVLSELGSLITSYRLDVKAKTLTPEQVITTLPDNFFGDSIASEICLDRETRTIHASNRGHNSVASFKINAEAGRLTSIGWTPTMGGNPRFIGLIPGSRSLVVLNQDSDTIVRFEITAAGKLRLGAEIAHAGSPNCLGFQTIS